MITFYTREKGRLTLNPTRNKCVDRMIARSPSKQRRETEAETETLPINLDPTLLRETVKKIDKCMVRLQELQYTISGSSVCKQESIKMKIGNPQRSSSTGNLSIYKEEWRRMSLPAMLLEETVGEIVKATRNIVHSHDHDDPTTPEKMVKQSTKHCQLHEGRTREKQRATRTQSDTSTSSQHDKSRIKFKFETENYCSSSRYVASRVSPRNRPWARKIVLFPNPLFQPSPEVARNPQKLLIKPAATSLANKSQAVLRRSFSPSRLAKRLVSPFNNRNGDGDAKPRRSFSPSMA